MEIDLDKCIDLLARGESFALATVIGSEGSVPRGPGARMSVSASTETTGTVGGGMVENLAIQACLRALAERGHDLKRFSLTTGGPESIGMICGGFVELLIEHIDAGDPANLPLFRQAALSVAGRFPGSLVTVIDRRRGGIQVNRSLLLDDEVPQNPPAWLPRDLGELTGAKAFSRISIDAARTVLLQRLASPPVVCIIGGGHVGQKLAELLHFVGLASLVVDDRPGMATRERFPTSRGHFTLPGYDGIYDTVRLPEGALVVIATKDSTCDQKALAQSLCLQTRYLGMIGSRAKIRRIFQDLEEKGVDPQFLAAVHTPIGLEINAETPAEIAVSIVAEIIQVLNQK